jgi:uncharacterized membrane protein YraQ (UPF0718 family)
VVRDDTDLHICGSLVLPSLAFWLPGIGNAAGGSKLCQSAVAVLIGCYLVHCKLSDTVPNLPLTFHLANEQLGILSEDASEALP